MFNSVTEAAAYLSGLIDGEGSVRSDSYNGCHSGSIVIWNSDPELLDAAEDAMRMLGAKPKRYARLNKKPTFTNTKPAFYTRIGRRQDIEQVARHIRLRSTPKRQALERCLKHYASAKKLPRHEWPLVELQRKLYMEGFTQRQAAQHFGVSQSTIERWNRALKS